MERIQMTSGIYPRISLEERFWVKVEKTPTCWNWTGSGNMKGYGKFEANGKLHLAHRIAYTLMKGTIPEGLTIDHLCRNRGCVNPEHLEVVSAKENILRGTSPVAIHAKQTRCIHGHSFSGANFTIDLLGRRICR